MTHRTPTPADIVFKFYREALAGHLGEIHADQPEAGWYKTRLVKRGAWVPVQIWLVQDIGDDDELLSDEVLKCTVDGAEKDPRDVWQWCCRHAIAEHEFRYLTALRAWQRINEPEAWDPYKAVDINRTAIEE